MSDWTAYVRARLGALPVSPEREQEIVAELAQQLEQIHQASLAAGVDEAAARRRAEAEITDWPALARNLAAAEAPLAAHVPPGIREALDAHRLRAHRGGNMLADLLQDLRYAIRGLRRTPGFTAIVLLTLALAIGANTAIFSLMDALLLRALPVRDPQSLVVLQWQANPRPQYGGYSYFGACRETDTAGCSFSLPFYRGLQTQSSDWAALTALSGRAQYNVSGHGPASVASGQMVAGNYFQTLGIAPLIGRLLVPADDSASAPPVMVLSYAYWEREFSGAADIVGTSVDVNGVPVVIAGVAGRRFAGLTPGTNDDAWLPLSLRPRLTPGWTPQEDAADSSWLVIVGRLRSGVARSRAQADASGRFRAALLAGPKPMSQAGAAPTVKLEPAQDGLVGIRVIYAHPLTVLLAICGALLLIACANIAGLLSGRANLRRREVALRRALGAGRGRIVRQLLAESVLLAGAGGALGLGLAYPGARVLLTMIADSGSPPPGFGAVIDGRVLLFTLAISVAAGVLFGTVPALRGWRLPLSGVLKEAAGDVAIAGGGLRRRGPDLASGLAVTQMALCIVVLAGAGLLVRSLENLRRVDPGFATANLLLFTVHPELIGYKGAAVLHLYDRLRQSIGAVPGILGVSDSMVPLLAGDMATMSFRSGGASGPEESVDTLPVGPGFFGVMHMQRLLGRTFASTDFVPEPDATSPPSQNLPRRPMPAVVNAAFVRKYIGKADPLGWRFGDPPQKSDWVVIGVVTDAKYSSLRLPITPTVYAPWTAGFATFEVRTAADPDAVLPAVRRAVAGVDASLPLVEPTTEAAVIHESLHEVRFMARLAGFFGLVALLLGCLGLYGLLIQDVTRRTREIGIRIALGAGRGEVLHMVVRRGAWVSAVGIGVGLGVAWGLTRYLRSLLFGVSATDLATLAVAATILLAVALLASYLPARRASRIDAWEALRHE